MAYAQEKGGVGTQYPCIITQYPCFITLYPCFITLSLFYHPKSLFYHPISLFYHPISLYYHPISMFYHPISFQQCQCPCLPSPACCPLQRQGQPLLPVSRCTDQGLGVKPQPHLPAGGHHDVCLSHNGLWILQSHSREMRRTSQGRGVGPFPLFYQLFPVKYSYKAFYYNVILCYTMLYYVIL
jgi:hypothetical protein